MLNEIVCEWILNSRAIYACNVVYAIYAVATIVASVRQLTARQIIHIFFLWILNVLRLQSIADVSTEMFAFESFIIMFVRTVFFLFFFSLFFFLFLRVSMWFYVRWTMCVYKTFQSQMDAKLLSSWPARLRHHTIFKCLTDIFRSKHFHLIDDKRIDQMIHIMKMALNEIIILLPTKSVRTFRVKSRVQWSPNKSKRFHGAAPSYTNRSKSEQHRTESILKISNRIEFLQKKKKHTRADCGERGTERNEKKQNKKKTHQIIWRAAPNKHLV